MTRLIWAGLGLLALGAPVTGALALAGARAQELKNSPRPADAPKTIAAQPAVQSSLAQRLAEIRAEYEKQGAERQRSDAEFSRRMIDLAMTAPADPAVRDALIWVIDKPYRSDEGAYGVEFARAVALLVRHFGNDPEAVRAGIGLDNVLTFHRDQLLLGFYAAAKGREGKGLARLALAQYLHKKAEFAAGARQTQGRRKIRYGGADKNGKYDDEGVDESDEIYAYSQHLRQCDPQALRTESERLYNEVIAEYADIPLITRKDRELAELLEQPTPTRLGKPLTDLARRRIEQRLARKTTLGESAQAHLDEMYNLVAGKPAPEIDGLDTAGKPLKLSDYRGKVVVLVFWGSWCGPCMREVPHERELAERLKDQSFALLGVDCRDDKTAAQKAIQSNKMKWPNWYDGGSFEGPIVKRYHVQHYPSVFVIDVQGIIRHREVLGPQLDKAVDDLLKEARREGQRPAG